MTEKSKASKAIKTSDAALAALIAEVSGAKNYRHIDAATVERVCREEAGKHPKQKEAAKAAKRRLHQMTGAYAAPERERESGLAAALLATTDRESVLSVLDAMARAHASTSERLPFAGELYADIRAQVGRITSVLDLACGINPALYLADCLRAGIELPQRYAAYDIRRDVLEQAAACFERFGIEGIADPCDLLSECPEVQADVTLLFKVVPLLAHQRKGRFEQVIAQTRSRFVAVTFPTRSLSGRSVGMAGQYRRMFGEYLTRTDYALALEKEYPSELLFLVEKPKTFGGF